MIVSGENVKKLFS